MPVIAIAIVAANGVIGDGDRQPFEIAEDWARFKRVTLGHPLIMGRRTHEAIGRWLPGRTTIVITSRPESITLPEPVAIPEPDEGSPEPDVIPEPDERPKRAGHAVASFNEALQLARGIDEEVYIAGGGSVYEQAWPYLTDLDLTEVHEQAEGEVRFPEIDPAEWVEVERDTRDGFDFVHYRRR